MAKWRENAGNTAEETERETGRQRPGDTSPRGESLRSGARRIAGVLATLVTVVAMVVCVVLALHIAFAVFKANPENSIVRSVNSWADWFAWRFRDVFVPRNARLGVVVNYGIAAVVYLIVGRALAGLIRRVD